MFKKIFAALTIFIFVGLIYFSYKYGINVGMNIQMLHHEGLEADKIARELEFPLPEFEGDGITVKAQNPRYLRKLETLLSKKIVIFGKYLETNKYFLFASGEAYPGVAFYERAIRYRLKTIDSNWKYDIPEPYSQTALNNLKSVMDSMEGFSEEEKKEEINKFKEEAAYYHIALDYFRKYN